MKIEKWSSIPGYEGIYEASTLGRVRRVVDATQARSYAGKILKPIHQHTGYHTVALYLDKIPTMLLLHRVNTSAFLGPCPDGLQVNHKDGDKANNELENLEYMTASENNLHAFATGLKKRGEEHHEAKLSEAEVLLIVEAVRGGSYQREAAADHGVTQANVSCIMRGKTWSHVTGITRRV